MKNEKLKILKPKLYFSFLISHFSFRRGFTLIELLVVISVMAILSTIGIAAFVSYSHTQAVNSAVLDVETMLQTARSDALSQVTTNSGQSVCLTASLTGYAVKICPSNKPTNCGDYKLYAVCDGSVSANSIESKNLPADIYFGSSSTFTFNVLNGVTTPGTIKIYNKYDNSYKTITLSPNGSISAK